MNEHPPITMPPKLDQVKSGMDDLIALIDLTRQTVAAGATVDLSGLEKHVESLCAAIQLLPPADAKALAPLLEKMAGGLDGLAGELASRKDDKKM